MTGSAESDGPTRRELGRVSADPPAARAGRRGPYQAASLTTLGPQSPWFVRLAFHTGRNDFVRRYGDTGEDEFAAAAAPSPSACC